MLTRLRPRRSRVLVTSFGIHDDLRFFDRVTGDVYWVPDETTATVSATVRVTDCHGASANFTFGVDVINREDPPVITSTPIRSARFNSNYYYDVDATDPDPGDTVTFQLLEGPTGMSIVTATGLISWAPTSSDAGTHRVRHFTEVRLSETEWYLFRPTIVDPQPIAGGCGGTVVFEQIDGVRGGAELVPFGHSEVRATAISPIAAGSFVQESHLTNTITGELYQPQSFRLMLADGRILDLSMRDGITRIEDRHGNWVRIVENGMSHSSGRSLHFVRDAQRRITQAIDSAGRSTGYEYDVRGNLVAFTDVLGRRTRYEYRNAAYPHHLTHIIDHRGVVMAALDFHDDGRLERMCDADGVCTRSNYDLGARAMVITDGLGQPTQYAYDQRGNVTDMVDALGNHTRMFYSAAPENHLIRREDPTGAITTYAYDPFTGQMSERVDPHRVGEDPEDFTTQWTYDTAGRMLSMTTPSGAVVTREYNTQGDEVAMRDMSGRALWSASYGSRGEILTESDIFGTTTRVYGTGPEPEQTIDPDGTTFNARYDAMGNLVELTGDGQTSRLGYDSLGREVFFGFDGTHSMRTTYADGADWSRIEDERGIGTTRHVTASGRVSVYESPEGATERYTYDALGRLRVTTDALGHRATRNYDAAGRLSREEDSATGAHTDFEYDPAGRVTATVDTDGHRTEMTYHPSGRLESLTDARNHTWSFARTPTTSTTTDPLLRQIHEERTPHGLVSAIVHADGTRTEMEYALSMGIEDASDYPTLIRDELGRERRTQYTSDLSIQSATDDAGNAWTYSGWESEHEIVTSPEGRVIETERNDAFEPVQILHEDGFETTFTYEEGNPDVVTRPGSITIDFTYADPLRRETRRDTSTGDWRELHYDSFGRIDTITDATGMTTHLFDSAGRPAGLRYPSGAETQLVRDAHDRITEVRVRPAPGATERVTTYEYDEVGNIARITDPLDGETTYSYDAVNRPILRVLPNGVRTTWVWDVRDRIESITHRDAANVVLASRTYVRTASGEPTRITHEDGSYIELEYDAALRVRSETWRDAGGTITETISYAYDRDGNRISRTTSAGVEAYVAGVGYRLDRIERAGAPIENYGWDAAGRMTSIERDGATTSLTYSALDQVTSAERGASNTSWSFDGEGRRVAMSDAAGTRRYLVAPTMIEELEAPHAITDASGILIAGYVYSGDQPLVRYGTSGPTYYLEDGIGSVIATADSSGARSSEFRYDAFGNTRAWSGTESSLDPTRGGDFRFQGMWQDQSTELYYVRARTYDARTGRFLSRDPLLGEPREVESHQPYNFANANPIINTDPTGAFTLAELQSTVTVDRVLTAIQSSARSYAVDEARDRVMEGVGQIVVHMIGQIAGLSPTIGTAVGALTNAFQAGREFENWIERGMCQAIPDLAGLDHVWFAVPLGRDGKPAGDGVNCGADRRPPSRDGRHRGYSSRTTVFPDVLLSTVAPSRINYRNQRSFLIIELKLSAQAIRSGNQFRSIVKHAQTYSWPPVAVWFTFRGHTEADEVRLGRMVWEIGGATPRPILGRIVSLF